MDARRSAAPVKPFEADPQFRRHFAGWPLLGRGGAAGDVAYAALFLASDESAWITGINLVVDGAMSCKTGITEH